MPDSETAAALRSLLEELCKNVSCFDANARTNAAAELFENGRAGKAVARRSQGGWKAGVADTDHVALAEAIGSAPRELLG